MADRKRPFRRRVEVSWCYPGITQSKYDKCVFASNASAVNYPTGQHVWSEQSLIHECNRQGVTQGEPRAGQIAHEPAKCTVGFVVNTKAKSALTNQTVREWVEQEGKVVIFSRQVQSGGRQAGWHMLTLVAWDSDHYVAWDTAGKTSIVYYDEIEQEIPCQNVAVLTPHPNHDAFVYWRKVDGAP